MNDLSARVFGDLLKVAAFGEIAIKRPFEGHAKALAMQIRADKPSFHRTPMEVFDNLQDFH